MDFLTFSVHCANLLFVCVQLFAMLMRLMEPPTAPISMQVRAPQKRKRTKKSAKKKSK